LNHITNLAQWFLVKKKTTKNNKQTNKQKNKQTKKQSIKDFLLINKRKNGFSYSGPN
jgi:hypothetical protein